MARLAFLPPHLASNTKHNIINTYIYYNDRPSVWLPNFIYGNIAGVAMSEKVDVCEGHNGNKVELPQFTEEHV